MTGADLLSPFYEGAGGYDRTLLNPGLSQYNGTDTDKTPIFHGAPVDYRIVADGHVIADECRPPRVRMNRSIVLDIGVFADADIR